MLKQILLLCAFANCTALLSIISSKGTNSQIIFESNTHLQTNTLMSGLSNTVLFPANSNFRLNNNNSNSSLGGITSSTITFGQENNIELTGDASIAQSDQTWIFPYDATIDGKGHTLTILAPQGITVSGSATLTITNAKIICASRQSLGCTSDTATILLDNTTLTLGSEGLFWGQGNLTAGQNFCVQGQDRSLFATPSNSEFIIQLTTLGFAVTTEHANSSLYTMDFSGPSDERSGISMVSVDKTGAAFYSDDNSITTRTWNQVTAAANPYVYASVGTDGTIWLADNAGNIYVYRFNKDSTPNLVTAQNVTGNILSVGNRFNVYALNSTSGNVYKCSDPDRGYSINPLTGAPQTWVQLPNVKATSIAAGIDGSLWYVNTSGQVILRAPDNSETLLHDGAGHTFVKVSAKGTCTQNSVALTCLATSRGYISQNNGPFKDIGLASVVEVATDADGNLMMIFDNSIIPEDPTYGAPIYYRHSFAEHPVLAMDRTLNFSASNGANLTIASAGTLIMNEDTTLRMNADNQCLEAAYNARRHLIFTDNSSSLLLNRANIEAVSAGLTLTQGTVVVNGNCALFASSWPGCQTEISSDVKLKIHAGSNLNAYGRVDYCATNRLYSNVPNSDFHTAPLTAPAVQNYLVSRGFSPVVSPNGPIPYNPAAVAYNTNSNTIKMFGTANAGGYVYFLASLDPTSIVPNFTNYVTRGIAFDFSDLGDDDGIIYYSNQYARVWLNGDNYGNNAGQGSGGLAGGIIAGPYDRNGPMPAAVSMADSGNYGFSLSDGTLYWWSSIAGFHAFSPGGSNALGQRTFSVAKDALWYADSVGEIWYIPASNTSLRVRYNGPRGMDILTICVRGTINNYKMIASDRQAKIYTADLCRKLDFENCYNPNNPYDIQTPSIASNGFLSVPTWNGGAPIPYFGYSRGYGPSGWSSPLVTQYYRWPCTSTVYLSQNALLQKGLACPVPTADLSYASNMSLRRVGQQLEFHYGYIRNYAKQVFNQDLTYSANPINDGNKGFLAGGNDGSYVYMTANVYPTQMISVDPNGNTAVILDNLNVNTQETSNCDFLVAMNDVNNIYLVRSSLGKLQKWGGGTTWNDVYTGRSGIPISMSISTDNCLWYTTKDGKLNFIAQDGTITPVKGSLGTKWIFVTTAGSSTQYKLLAIRQDGMLYSADQSRLLESEQIYSLNNAAIAENGFFIARGLYGQVSAAGWIKGTAPKWWQKLYPVSS